MKKLFSLLGAILLLTAGFSYAQERTGELNGTVVDDTAVPLPGVTVEARSPSLMGIGVTVTNEAGQYRLIKLPPGNYTITFKLPGFNTLRREGILIRLGGSIRLNAEIAPVTVEEEITIIGQSPLVDIRKSSSTFEITKEMFSKLPKGRNFSSIVTAISGVNDESELDGISMDGASSSENVFFIDGVDTTGMYDGTSGQRVMFEFIEEVQVKSSGYEAQFGGSMGGVINVVTRSGGSEFHGEVLLYTMSDKLNGESRPTLRRALYDNTSFEYIAYPEDNWNRYEVGFALGGYLIRDKLWFFGAYLPRFELTKRTTYFEPDVEIQKQFTMSEQWHHASFKLTYQPVSSLRLSASWNTDDYKWRGDLPSRGGTSPVDYNWAGAGHNYPGWTATMRGDLIASQNMFFSVYGGYFRTNHENIIGPPGERYYFYETNVGIPGVPADMEKPQGYYNYPSGDRYQTTTDVQVKMTASIDGTVYFDAAGEHMLKAGFQFNRLTQDIFDAAPYDSWYFEWGHDYEGPSGTTPTTFGYMMAYDPLGTVAKISSNRMALFLQDSWTIGNKLTLNFGIRAEKEDIPSFVDPDNPILVTNPEFGAPPIAFGFIDKLAPRIGFAYDIFGDASLKVFGSFGMYYDVMKLDMAEGSYGGFKWQAHYYEIPAWVVADWHIGERDHVFGTGSSDGDLAPYFIESLDWRIPSYDTTQPSRRAIDKDVDSSLRMKPYSKMEFTFGVQKQLVEDVTLTARFLHNRIIWAIEDVGIQTAAGEQYYNSNPGSKWVNEIYATNAAIDPQNLVPLGATCPKAQREYTSVDVGFDKRFSDNWMAGLHYTWSRLWGNFAGLASSEEHGRKDPNVERYFDVWFLHYTSDPFVNGVGTESTGLLPTDRPHQFKFYGAYSLPMGLTVGLNAYAASGTPVTREFELNNADGYYPEGRFTDGRTPFLWRADVYVEYNMKISDKQTIQFSLNVDNVTNNRIAQRIFNLHNYSSVYLSNDEVVAGFDYEDVMAAKGTTLDPRFLQPHYFQNSFSARFGIKFIF
jgi:hypothetical protein